MGEKMRGARTAGAALNPGLNAEAADSIAASTTNIAAAADTISRRPPSGYPRVITNGPSRWEPPFTMRKEGLL